MPLILASDSPHLLLDLSCAMMPPFWIMDREVNSWHAELLYGNITMYLHLIRWSASSRKDHFVYAPSQWKTTLQCNVGVDPIIVAHYQGHKPIHWKTRRAGNDNVYTGLTQYTVNVIQNQREVRYVHQILFPIRYFWHPIPPFKTHTQFKDSPPSCSPLCNTTKTNMAPI